MRLRVVHDTRYSYDAPARGILQRLRLTPRDDDGQHAVRWRVEPSVEGRLTSHVDHFGNVVHTFAPDADVAEIRVVASGEVITTDTSGVVRDRGERAPEAFYLRETPLTTADEAIRAFADEVAGPERGDTLDLLHRLLSATCDAMTFDTEPTQIGTSAAEAFAIKRGVCPDITHIFLAAARHLGIPSRFVSGYFLPPDGAREHQAAHAWAEAKVPGLGWVGFDPTFGLCSTDAHVRVAVGLDAPDTAPIRGTRRGGGQEWLRVRLLVEPIGPAGQSQSQG